MTWTVYGPDRRPLFTVGSRVRASEWASRLAESLGRTCYYAGPGWYGECHPSDNARRRRQELELELELEELERRGQRAPLVAQGIL